MFHAVYSGSELTSLSINVKANAPGEPVIPLTLQPDVPSSINYDTALAVQIQWGTVWLGFMPPVYVPTIVPGTDGKLKINWSPDDQVVVLMDEHTSS